MAGVEDLLTRSADITPRSQTGPADRYNQSTWESGDVLEGVPCYFEQIAAEEITDGRQTEIATGMFVFPAGTEVDGSDWVTLDGTTYQVLGPPARAFDPNTGEDHVEAKVKVVTG